MKQQSFQTLLRSAVIAAIPLATQLGCSAAETKTTETKTDSGGIAVSKLQRNDPCRAGETTLKSGQEAFSAQTKLVEKTLSADECIALCKQTFERNRIGNIFSGLDLVKLESIEATNCKTVNRPFSVVLPGGQYPEPSTLVSCDVSYTAQHSPYTCPRPVVGRIPNGMHAAALQAAEPDSIGEYLADMAAMETAAVTAFAYLGRELEAYGAPIELIARAQAAVQEETRHAEMAGLLAAAHATAVPKVEVDGFTLRALYDIALENAVEGCVNETFAAACGLWQSEHARLDVFREVIAHISDEETGHAALSWDIHAWIMPQLTAAQQAEIAAAQVAAVDKLMRDFRQEGNPVLQRAFGLPTRAEAGRLFAQLQRSVWAVLLPVKTQAIPA